ncbi:unnamed protein product [Strongylus vulgaris]|uniref:Uncharacterized protein n=1 Tax=Strongylus vulgaris TaxID=40348 RepID=A0A3P7J9U7_STRVU|nr:unnamed protein product [Strongylus vulgaris]
MTDTSAMIGFVAGETPGCSYTGTVKWSEIIAALTLNPILRNVDENIVVELSSHVALSHTQCDDQTSGMRLSSTKS